MNQAYNVSSAPKTTTFQMRMNPEIKQRAEQLYASYGLIYLKHKADNGKQCRKQ